MTEAQTISNHYISETEKKTDQSIYIPQKDPKMISPIISAKSSIGIDLPTGMILYEKDIHEKRQIASLTKIMTILIILEENKLDEVVTVSANAASTEGTKMYLKSGEKITVENLLYGTLIHSANDAAIALAEYNAGSIKKFVEKMNNRATLLGLDSTHYSNPAGLDDPNNYSSAHDLAKLARHLYKQEFVQKNATTKSMTVYSVSKDQSHNLETTNDLLGTTLFKILGLKTGTTQGAGLCFVSIAQNNQTGSTILTVVLNSPERFKESKILIDWIFRAYTWNKI